MRLNFRFESRVILDGSQTDYAKIIREAGFESRVILDGSQTKFLFKINPNEFESRVILDGSQTFAHTIRKDVRV